MSAHQGKSKGWIAGVFVAALAPLLVAQSRPAEPEGDPDDGPEARPHRNVTVALGAAGLTGMPVGDLVVELARIRPVEAARFRAGTYKPPMVLRRELWLTPEESRQEGAWGGGDEPDREEAPEKIRDAGEQLKRRLAYAEPYAAELRKAWEGSQAPPAEQRERIVKQYSLCVLSLAVYKHRLEEGQTRREGSKNEVARPAGLAVPEGLPADLDGYLRGAIAWYDGRREEAMAAWRKTVESGGKNRAVWAAFMLGRACMGKDAEEAVGWFRRTRELAAMPGMDDSRFLAAESYGLEARVELGRKNYTQAIKLYLAQQAAGDPSAPISLRDTVLKALLGPKPAQADEDAVPAAMAALAGDAQGRQVVTAWLLSDGGPRTGRPFTPTARQAKAWLGCVANQGNLEVSEPASLAWLALRCGDAAAAKSWSDRAARPSLVADWVRAKLAFAQGQGADGQAALEPLLKAPGADEVWAGVFIKPEESGGEPFCPRKRIAGELAILQVVRGQYADALAGLIERGYWADAAYVAERLMTTPELKAFVDARCPEAAAKYWPEEAAPAPAPLTPEQRDSGDVARGHLARRVQRAATASAAERPGRLAARLRYLLARRLVREGRLDQAGPYLLPGWRNRLKEYADLLAAARDAKTPPAEAGQALWRAALIAKEHGMELMGMELGPEWTICDGWASYDDPAAIRAAQAGKGPYAPTADELTRLAASAPKPNRRSHYRFVAAELAWQAAALMPDEKPQTSIVLHTAGCWIRSKDPQLTDRYYKALVRRCGTTELGKKAKEAKWLP